MQPIASNTLSALAGNLTASMDIDGTGASAAFSSIIALASDKPGNIYVAQRNVVRKISQAGVVTTLAGALNSISTDSVDGPGESARFGTIGDITLDTSGNIYVVDSAVRKVAPDGFVTTITGGPSKFGYLDGLVSEARFNRLQALTVAANGDIYVIDTTSNFGFISTFFVRKIDKAGTVSTIPGSVLDIKSGRATGIAVDAQGNIYISVGIYEPQFVTLGTPDRTSASYILKLIPNGVAAVFAGSALPNSQGAIDGPGLQARFRNLTSMAVDSVGTLYVADSSNYSVRRVTAQGIVSTVVGVLPGAIPSTPQIQLGTLPGKLTYVDKLAIDPNGVVHLAVGSDVAPNRIILRAEPQ